VLGAKFISGYRVHFDSHLRAPRLERERFSGGINESARERNAHHKKEASKVYLIGDDLIVPEWLRSAGGRRSEIPVRELRKGGKL
jgi:hypothetical protein